jgi:aminoglycoside 6'-N-acetyltransferase
LGESIAFRPLQAGDYDTLYRWLTNEAVARWWDRPASLAEVAAHYNPDSADNADMSGYFIEVRGGPIGYIQRYDGPGEGEQGIDLFIGEDSQRHRGLGAAIITSFIRRHVFSDASTQRCVVDPSPKNVAAIRAYAKAGFTIDRSRSDETTTIMTLPRPAFRDRA